LTASLRATMGRHADLALVSLVVGILVVLFVPIPAALLDVLVLSNFSFALLILLLTFYMARPVEFSTFPSLLLVATLFRLSLNIAATRLILTDADAGKVINAVGSLVVGGNYVIGLIVFLILVVVQYVVVTSGAQRVSEVAARFTLDSMPGQQMSIDADLNMGFIDQAEAMRRRKLIEKEAGFYGAMDGASKFVKGDAIAGIVMIVAAVVTAGAALGAMGLLAPGAAGLMGLGASLAGSLGLAGLGGGAGVAAAAGMGAAIYAGASILTQGLAVASGLQEKFSWKAVAKSAVSGAFAGASAALPGYFGVAVNPTTGVATSFNAKLVAAQVGTEVVRQKMVDGKVSSVAGILGAALQAGAMAKAGTAGDFVAKNFGAVRGGLRITEGLARGDDNALDWVSMAGATLGIEGNVYSANKFNWQDVALTAAGAAIVGARRGQDAALNFIGQAIAVPLGNSLATTFSSASGTRTDPLGDFINKNMSAWEQRQANYDQIVGAFSNPGPIDRSDDVLTADRLTLSNNRSDGAAENEVVNTIMARKAAKAQETLDMLGTAGKGLEQLRAGRPAQPVPARGAGELSSSILYQQGLGHVRELTITPGNDGWHTTSEGVVQRVEYLPSTDAGSLPAIQITAKRDSDDIGFDPAVVDQQILEGSYNAFGAVRSALADGRYGDAWRYASYTPSAQARDAAIARTFPSLTSDATRLQNMLVSPGGTTASLFTRWLGGSQRAQDAALAITAAAGGLAGASTGVYKQTLTAAPPMFGTHARVRGPGKPARALPGTTPETKRGVVQFQGLEVRAVRDLGHIDASTLRAMQKYGFAAKDGAGSSLIMHHHQQNPSGPIVEMPAGNHSIGKATQHPFGNTKGSGLSTQQRAEFDQWRVDYWKWRATQELQNRGLQ
jgi:hypothetical protein